MFSPVPVDEDDGVLNELLAFLDRDGYPSNGTDSTYNVPAQSAAHGATSLFPGPPPVGEQRQTNTRSRGNTSGGTASSSRSKRVRDADKVKELEAMAAAQMEHFAALVQRNAELKYKNKILSDAVMLRDLQLQIGRGVRQSAAMSAAAAFPQMPAAPGGPPSDSPGLNPVMAATVAQAVFAPGSMRTLLSPEFVPDLDYDSVRAMGKAQLLARWKAYCTEASELLLALEDDPGNEAAAVRMRELSADTGGLFRLASVLNPDVVLALMQTHMETDTLAAPEPGHWPRVLAAMRLTDEQLRDLRAVYELYSSIMRGVLTERQALQAQLSRGLQQAQLQGPLASGLALALPPEAELLPALERNMRKEASAHLLLRAFVFGRTLSIVQMCRAVVHSYPFFPNTTGLAAAAAGVVA